MRELLRADRQRVLISRGIACCGTLNVRLIILIPDLIDGTGENIKSSCGSDGYTRTTVTGRGRISSSEDGRVETGTVFARLGAFVRKHCVVQGLGYIVMDESCDHISGIRRRRNEERERQPASRWYL